MPHELVRPFAALLGTWVGRGHGTLPDDRPDFSWQERLVVTAPGPPALCFQQRTRRPDGSPFHAEDGWIRIPPEAQPDDGPAVVELAVTSPTGVLEACRGEGTAGGGRVVLDATSTTVARTEAAAVVHETRRRWELVDGVLTIDFWMATPTFPERFHHLRSVLRREDG